MSSDVLSGPQLVKAEQSCVLSRQICALQVVTGEDGGMRWGPVVKLPQGTRLRCFGAGFNKHTVRVQVKDSFFFVFREDIDRESEAHISNRQLARKITSGVKH
jgi:hypothetical protein